MKHKEHHDDEPRTTSPHYQIAVEGQLDARWARTFEGMTLTTTGGHTLIEGPVADQAALHGILRIVRDLGLELVSVTRSTSGQP